MYNIAVIGSGYVGLVAGACFSDTGNKVTCLDIDQKKIDNLKNGIVPIFEPGLEKLIEKNVSESRLMFSTDLNTEIPKCDILFIAVGTPPGEDGSADLKYVLSVAKNIGQVIDKYTVVVDKSTVPVGTADLVTRTIQEELDNRNSNVTFNVVSNPEFLREGAAIDDFMKPDRVVIGTDDEKAAKIMTDLYQPFVRNDNPIMIMNTKSAELTKYAANSMLALRISFMNEIANMCERVGANVDEVRKGIGADFRIGKHFLYSGIGYGGSCFPKDVKALIKTADDNNYNFKILKMVEEVNASQKMKMVNHILEFYENNIEGKVFALWGLSFKPNTDDMREAPSLVIIDEITKRGGKIIAFDPEAMEEAKHYVGDKIKFAKHKTECFDNTDALVIATEWNEFRNPDYELIKNSLKDKVIFDGRNLFSTKKINEYNLNYFSIGREAIELK